VTVSFERLHLLFGAMLDAAELVLPEPFKCASPFMQRLNGLGVGPVEHLAAVPTDMDQADVPQDPEMLGDGRLLQLQEGHDGADRTLLQGKIAEYLATPRLCNGVEGVGSGSGAGHEENYIPI
jgi:hypothetical protein